MTRTSVFLILSAFFFLIFPTQVSAETTSDVKCTGCVGSPDILDFGVKTKDIGEGAVTAPKINGGAVNWEKLASDLQDRIMQLEATVATLEDALTTNSVLKLDGYLDLDTTDPAKPTARFAGVNVQVVNGLGVSWSFNGVGNVILGYDETFSPFFGDDPICSIGFYGSQEECETNGGVWASDHKSGSHNVIVGPAHRYSQFGGLAVGQANAITGYFASVTGGFHNKARGDRSSISGGDTNEATGGVSSISGGFLNRATGQSSSVLGGEGNHAGDAQASVSGGQSNTANGYASSVSGGLDREADGDYDWVAGSLSEDQ